MRRVEDGTSFHAGTDGIVAALVLSAAVAVAFYLPRPIVFDPYAPDFNPAVLLPVVLCVFALRYGIPAAWSTLQKRRFGQSVMEMEGLTVAPGETLKGVVRSAGDLEPLGDYELRLRCVQKVLKRADSTTPRLQDEIRAQQTLRVSPQGVNPRNGIPFAFKIPEDALSTTVLGAGALDLIGGPQGEVRWILEVTAPLSGLDFYAIFGVPVRARA